MAAAGRDELLRWVDAKHGPAHQKAAGGKRKKAGQVSEIAPRLLLGNHRAAADADLVAKLRVRAIVNVGGGRFKLPEACGVALHRISVLDKPNNPILPHLAPACAFIDDQLARGEARHECVLVHCRAGIHRSPAMVVAFLVRRYGLTREEAEAVCVRGRCSVDLRGHFWDELGEWERLVREGREGSGEGNDEGGGGGGGNGGQ